MSISSCFLLCTYTHENQLLLSTFYCIESTVYKSSTMCRVCLSSLWLCVMLGRSTHKKIGNKKFGVWYTPKKQFRFSLSFKIVPVQKKKKCRRNNTIRKSKAYHRKSHFWYLVVPLLFLKSKLSYFLMKYLIYFQLCQLASQQATRNIDSQLKLATSQHTKKPKKNPK